MYKINVNNQSYDCPSNWGEVTLNQYMHIVAIPDEIGNISRIIKILNILTGIEEEIIEQLDISTINQINFDWLKEKIKADKIQHEVEIDGVKYGVADFKKMTLGEYADAEEFCRNDYISNLHKLIAVLVRPLNEKGEVEKYDGDEVEQRAKLFKNKMNIENMVAISNFFLGLKEQL